VLDNPPVKKFFLISNLNLPCHNLRLIKMMKIFGEDFLLPLPLRSPSTLNFPRRL